MWTVTSEWFMPVNIGVIVLAVILILWGAKQGFLLMIVSLLGTVASFFGAWFLGGILADYIRLWPRSWAIMQDTAIAAAAWQWMNEICWFLTLFVVFRIVFAFITMICRGLQDVPIIKEVSALLGGVLGAAETMIFVLVLTVALNSPLFNNGQAAVDNTIISKINYYTGMIYERFLEPIYDADTFNQAYEDAAAMTKEQRQNLRDWLESRGYSSDVEGLTDLPEEENGGEEAGEGENPEG